MNDEDEHDDDAALTADLARRDPVVQMAEQTHEAGALLDDDVARIISWPYATMDATCGPMRPGSVAYVASFSGQGKTTFVTNVIARWLDAGVRCYVMPLESEAKTWRVHHACATLGIDPGEALSGRLRQLEAAGDATARATRERIQAELVRTATRVRAQQLYVSPDPLLSFSTFRHNLNLASAWGFPVVIVDHVDHVEADDGRTNPSQASEHINTQAGELAKALGLVLILTSQLNLEALRANAGDHLARYGPPREHHLWRPAPKLKVATQVLGLFRPLDPTLTTEAQMAARRGDADPHTVLEPNRMGVVALKLRHYGARTGTRVSLAYERGQLRDLDLRERADVEARTHGIRTGGRP